MKLYAARDKDGALFIFNTLPKKCEDKWLNFDGWMMSLDTRWFPSIRWEDEGPTEVTLEIAYHQSGAQDKFHPIMLKPFTKVLARKTNSDRWISTHFSRVNYYQNNGKIAGVTVTNGAFFKHCIPYNEETKHLLGTKEEEPPKYKWW